MPVEDFPRPLPLVAAAIFLFCAPASAVVEKGDVDLGTIVVSAQRQEVPSSYLSQNVEVIGRGEIARASSSTAADVVRSGSSVDVSQRTQFDHTVPLAVRGSESRHVLLLLDGIPFNNQVSQQADVLPFLPTAGLERIEVLKGPGSSAWGGGLGGVVQLLTRDPSTLREGVSGSETSSFAGYKAQSHSADLAYGAKDWAVSAGGDYSLAGGARKDPLNENKDDSIDRNFYAKSWKKISDVVDFESSGGYVGAQSNDGVLPSSQIWQALSYYARFGQAQLKAHPSEDISAHARVKMNRQRIQTETFDAPTAASLFYSDIANNYYGVDGQVDWRPGDRWFLTAGYDGSYTVVKSPLLLDSKDVIVQAPFVQGVFAGDPVRLNLGARYD